MPVFYDGQNSKLNNRTIITLRKGNPLIRPLQYSCIREAIISLQTGKSILRQTV